MPPIATPQGLRIPFDFDASLFISDSGVDQVLGDWFGIPRIVAADGLRIDIISSVFSLART